MNEKDFLRKLISLTDCELTREEMAKALGRIEGACKNRLELLECEDFLAFLESRHT